MHVLVIVIHRKKVKKSKDTMLGFLSIRKKHITLFEDRKLRKKQEKSMCHGKKLTQTTAKDICKF